MRRGGEVKAMMLPLFWPDRWFEDRGLDYHLPAEAMFSSLDWFIAVFVVVAAMILRHNVEVVPIRSGNRKASLRIGRGLAALCAERVVKMSKFA